MVVVEHVEVVGEVGDVDVVAAVVVVVADGHAHVRLLPAVAVEGGAGGVADVVEAAVAAVAIHVVRPGVVGDDQVEPAVVVEIDPGDAEAVAALLVGHSSLPAGFGERAVAVVAEEMIRLHLADRAGHTSQARRDTAEGRARRIGRAHPATLRGGAPRWPAGEAWRRAGDGGSAARSSAT